MIEGAHPDPELLSAHLDGELSPLEESPLKAHLVACPACRGALQALHETKRKLSGASRPEMPETLARAIASRLEMSPQGALGPEAAPSVGRGASRWAPWAALALAAMLAGFWLRGFLAGSGREVEGALAHRSSPARSAVVAGTAPTKAKNPPDLLCRSIEWGPDGRGEDLPISCPPGYLKESTAKSEQTSVFPSISLKSVSPTPRSSNEAQAKKP